jgi:signal transduction histidine kinase
MADTKPDLPKEQKGFEPISPEHAARLDAIARVTGAIAHDFNNLIMLVNGYADLLLNQTAEEDRRRTDIQSIHQAGQRAAALTRQLLATGRRLQMKMAPLELNQFLQSQEGALRQELGSHVSLTLVLDPATGPLRADPSQLLAALLELARNARESMPEGGSVTVRTEAAPGCILIHVSDTGRGVADDLRARLFEPFFTTKPRRLGKGLGLAVVYGIVKQTGGEIGLRSIPGEGATFSLRFPRS